MTCPTRRQSVLRCHSLEERLAPANLHLSGVALVDAYAVAQAAPVTGQMIYVQANYSTSSMVGGEQFVIRFTVDGVPVDTATITASAGGGSFSISRGGWYATPGAHTLAATVDVGNTVFETNEADNSASAQVTTVSPTDLPQKFLRPLGYTLNSDWAVNNYADVDPRPGVQADYRGGQYQSSGNDGTDIRPFGFNRMDAGIPILAAADGTVTTVVDGNFDRNTTANTNPSNNVRISHGNNWETRYDQLMRYSITVKVGDVVKAGQIIGLMGSSGNSTGQHVHFSPYYRGCPVEMGFDTVVYQAQPMPYAGDIEPFAFEAGITNYDPMVDILEHPSPLTSYSTTQSGIIHFWGKYYNVDSSDTLTWKWYRPDGTQAYSNNYIPGNFRFSYWWLSRPVSSFTSTPGNWQVAQLINGTEVKRSNFTVAAGAAVPAIKITDPADKIVLDGRSTPIDFGSVARSGTAPIRVFTIINHGGAALNLSNYVLPPGFSVVGVPPTSIAADSVGFLVLQLDTSVVGTKFGTFRVDTNDPHVPTYNFVLSGTVTGTAAAGTPVIDLSEPQALAYHPLDSAKPLAPTATLNAPSSASIASLRVEFAANGLSQDQLGIRHQGNGAGQIGVSGAAVTFGGVVIGSFAGGTNSNPFVFTLNSLASPTAVQALIRNITYSNSEAIPVTAPRSVRFSVMDNAARLSNLAIKNVSVSDLRRVIALSDLPNTGITRGATFSRTGSFTDATGSNWMGTVDYGDGSGVQPLTINSDKTFTLAHVYTGVAGPYTATVTIINDVNAISTTTFNITVVAPNQVASSLVDDGSVQRSLVRSLTVGFTQAVPSFAPGAFTLIQTGGFVPLTVTFNSAQTVATLTFPTRSLDDGTYTLTLDSSKFQDSTSGGLDGNGDGLSGGNYILALYRLFGDINGDRIVNATDFIRMRLALGGFDYALDLDGDGHVAANDFIKFRTNFGVTI